MVNDLNPLPQHEDLMDQSSLHYWIFAVIIGSAV